MLSVIDAAAAELGSVEPVSAYGTVVGLAGTVVEAAGLDRLVSVGAVCEVTTRTGDLIPCEVVAFRDGRALLMSFGALEGVGPGCRVLARPGMAALHPTDAWLGRIVDGFGRPLDGGRALPVGVFPCPFRRAPPSAHARQRVAGKVDLGVRCLNVFTTCCRGQRLGIFAGSGVGKSTLMSMLARYARTDVIVIGLVGERGRELREFIEDDLGPEGLARSVVVVATSDESPLLRRQAALSAMAVAEGFRDQGKHVLLLMDSLTRYAMALREVGLSAGEPPASKGYPPSVFAELARLVERAGPGCDGEGAITAIFTVLVEGDDHNEPVSDAVRGLLDGHIVLDRKIAERGRFPAVDVLRSVSRSMPACNTAAEQDLVARARRMMSLHHDMAELVRMGAYRRGADPDVDKAVKLNPAIEALLAQKKSERVDLANGYAQLQQILLGAGA